MSCSRASVNAARWSSSIRRTFLARSWTPSRHSPPTSCSTQPAPPTCWCVAASYAAIPVSGSSSVTPTGSSLRKPSDGHRDRRGAGPEPLDVLDDFRGFYFDTALSSSPAALLTLLAFARLGHVLFGSDWPSAPTTAGQYFATGRSWASRTCGPRSGVPRSAPNSGWCSRGNRACGNTGTGRAVRHCCGSVSS
jgi:hypothetical protein